MSIILKAAVTASLILLISVSASAGSLSEPAGYTCIDTPVVMPAGAWFGGFDVLPNGNFVISDGSAIREITPGGTDVRTLYTYSGSVYGSFVRYSAASGKVYFGESSNGTIMSVAASGGTAALVTTLTGNYDMDFLNGAPYVVAKDTVYLVDEGTGATDAVTQVAGASGPIIFDSAGNMIYGTGNTNWPPTQNDQNIYQWSAAQVAGAVGSGVLSAADATTLAANVDAPSGFTWDGEGELVFTDSQVSPGVLRVLRNGEGELLASSLPAGAWTTAVHYNAAAGGISAAVSWFDASYNSYTVISTLTTAAPVPEPGSFAALLSLVGLVGSAKLLRSRGK